MSVFHKTQWRILASSVFLGSVWIATAQDSPPAQPVSYFDEPAWVHERPPALTDRVWHAKPAPADAKRTPLQGVRVVDYGDEIVRRHHDLTTGQGALSSHLGITRLTGQDVEGTGEKTGRIQYREFSLEHPFCGRPPSYDVEANSAVFYGGAVLFLSGEKGGEFEEFGINTGEGKNWSIIAKDSSVRSQAYSMVLWKKEDFRYGGDASRVSFDETSKIGLHVMRYMWRMDELRYVIQDGEQFYISEYNCGNLKAQEFFHAKENTDPESFGLSEETVGTGGGAVFGLNPTQTRWAKYDPTAPYHIAFDTASATYENHTFTDVQSVGFYVAKTDWEPKAMAIKWYGFEVLGTVHRPDRVSETLDMATFQPLETPPFHISKCEIPYVLFQRVRRWAVAPQFVFDEFYPYVTLNDGDMGSMDFGVHEHGSDEPVTDLTWLDAALWCNMLSEYEGREPVYYLDAEFTLPQRRACVRRWGHRNSMYDPQLFVKWSADGYRLPTAAEWMAAADGVNFSVNHPGQSTLPVGTTTPSKNGLYDLHGNVWEYIWDAGKSYDPSPTNFIAKHTVLGGDFTAASNPWKNKANPYGDEPHNGHFSIGLRVVRREKNLPAPPLNLTTPASIPAWVITQNEKGPGIPLKTETDVLDMLKSKEGSYLRGDSAEIFVSDSFFAKTELSYTQWKTVRDWAVHRGYSFNYDGDMGSMDYQTWKHRHHPDEPVTGISRADALIWCNALSEMEGRKPCYYSDSSKTKVIRVAQPVRAHWSRRSALIDRPALRVLGWKPDMKIEEMGYMEGPAGTFDTYGLGPFKQVHGGGFPPPSFGTRASVDWSADGYRLPTLAEWTVACQSGTDTKYYWGDDPDLDGQHVWSWQNSGGKTQPVGGKPANEIGLQDMLGNVFEMCWASANRNKGQASKETWNPKGSSGAHGIGAAHLMQGGSFLESTVSGSSNYAFDTGGGNPKQGNRQSSSIWNWNAFTHLGFRPVRCEARTHRSSGSEMPEDIQILDVNLNEPVTPLQGQTHRANLQRTGLFYSEGIRTQPRLKWSRQLGGQIRSCPLAFRDQLYVATDKGLLYALETQTGDETWSFQMAGAPGAELGQGYHANVYPSAPTLKDDILYIGCDRKGDGKGWAYLYAIDIQSGQPKWSSTVRNTKYVMGSPLPAYGAVFVAIAGWGRDTGLMALHGETGQILTIYRGIKPSKASMSFADGNLLVGQKVIDMRSGFSRGGANQGGNYGGNNTVIMHEGITYAVGGWEGFVSSVKASDYRSGLRIFSTPIEPGDTQAVRNGTADNTLSLWNNRLYFGTREGNAYARDADSGETLWKTNLGAPISGASILSTTDPTSTQATVYIGCDDGTLWALDAVTGKKLWNYKTGGSIWLDPWISDGTLYIASDDGTLYALEN